MNGIRYLLSWIIIGSSLLLPFAKVDIYPSAIPCLQFLLIILAVMWIIKEIQGKPTTSIEEKVPYKVVKIIREKEDKDYLVLEEDKKDPILFETKKDRIPQKIKEGDSMVLKDNKFIMA